MDLAYPTQFVGLRRDTYLTRSLIRGNDLTNNSRFCTYVQILNGGR